MKEGKGGRKQGRKDIKGGDKGRKQGRKDIKEGSKDGRKETKEGRKEGRKPRKEGRKEEGNTSLYLMALVQMSFISAANSSFDVYLFLVMPFLTVDKSCPRTTAIGAHKERIMRPSCFQPKIPPAVRRNGTQWIEHVTKAFIRARYYIG